MLNKKIVLDPEVQIRDWPWTFLVEGESPDRAIIEFFDDKEIYPHLVDLEHPAECSCRDYQVNILRDQDGRTKCRHILAAERYKALIQHKPKPLPTQLYDT